MNNKYISYQVTKLYSSEYTILVYGVNSELFTDYELKDLNTVYYEFMDYLERNKYYPTIVNRGEDFFSITVNRDIERFTCISKLKKIVNNVYKFSSIYFGEV